MCNPTSRFACDAIDELEPNNGRTVDANKLSGSQSLRHGFHRFMQHPAITIGVNPNVVAFGGHFVDQCTVDALESPALRNPYRIFIDGPPERAFKDEVCFVAVDSPCKRIGERC